MRSGSGSARTIQLFHIISDRPSDDDDDDDDDDVKQPLMVRTFLITKKHVK